MNIKINNKKIKIRPACLLTVGEYIEISKLESVNFVDYLRITTGENKAMILNTPINQSNLSLIQSYIGKIKRLQDFKGCPETLYINGEFYKTKLFKWQAVGTRLIMQEFLKRSQNEVEISVYLLAVLIDGTFDSETTENKFEELKGLNYLEIMETAAFFLRKHFIGSILGKSILQNLRKMFTKIKIQFIGKAPGSKN